MDSVKKSTAVWSDGKKILTITIRNRDCRIAEDFILPLFLLPPEQPAEEGYFF